MKLEVKDRTDEVIKEKNEAIEMALEIIGGKMERYAKQKCPVDTGLLRNSITYCLDGEMPHIPQYQAEGKSGEYAGDMPKEDDGKRSVSVGTNVEYAPIVEFNEKAKHHSGQKSHFLRDSLSNHVSEYNKILANELKKIK